MLPYRSLRQLESVLIARDGGADALRPLAESIRDNVIEAISLSEGLRHPGLFSRYLALRMTRMRDASIRSYRLFQKEAFEVKVPSYGALDDYLECSPDALELTARPEYGHATLRISLDLLEMLELIRSGYRPQPSGPSGHVREPTYLPERVDEPAVQPDHRDPGRTRLVRNISKSRR